MKVRVFIMPWASSKAGDIFYVSNTILDHLNGLQLLNVPQNWIYPDNDISVTNAVNLKSPLVIGFISAPNNFNFNELENLPGVMMLPAHKPINPTSNIPQVVRDKMHVDLLALGITINEAETWGDTIKNLALAINHTKSLDKILATVDFD